MYSFDKRWREDALCCFRSVRVSYLGGPGSEQVCTIVKVDAAGNESVYQRKALDRETAFKLAMEAARDHDREKIAAGQFIFPEGALGD